VRGGLRGERGQARKSESRGDTAERKPLHESSATRTRWRERRLRITKLHCLYSVSTGRYAGDGTIDAAVRTRDCARRKALERSAGSQVIGGRSNGTEIVAYVRDGNTEESSVETPIDSTSASGNVIAPHTCAQAQDLPSQQGQP